MPDAPLIYQSETVDASPVAGAETVIAHVGGVNTRWANQDIKLHGWCNITPDETTTAVQLRLRRAKLTGTLVGVPLSVAPASTGVGGGPVVRAFPIAFDDVGLAAGLTIFTPTPGDILLDAWVQIDTAWDGATPFCDLGTAVGAATGLFGTLLAPAPLDATAADLVVPGYGFAVGFAGPSGVGMSAVADARALLEATGVGTPFPLSVVAAATSLVGAPRAVPALLTAAPIKVWVSQDGLAGGVAPGATQGQGVVYLVTATPTTLPGSAASITAEAEVEAIDGGLSLASGTYVLTAQCVGATAPAVVNGVLIEARVD